jgi:hypothetical protein
MKIVKQPPYVAVKVTYVFQLSVIRNRTPTCNQRMSICELVTFILARTLPSFYNGTHVYA